MHLDGIYVRRDPSKLKSEPLATADLRFGGIEGDVHFGLIAPAGGHQSIHRRGVPVLNWRQLAVVAVEELAETASRLGIPELRPEWIGSNLAVAGIRDLSRLAAGSRLIFDGGAVILVTEENFPCMTAGKSLEDAYPFEPDVAPRFVAEATGRRGVMALVEREGAVTVGEGFRIRPPKVSEATS